MRNRILYWFVTLPSLLKVGCVGTLSVLFACSCLVVASMPNAYARGVAMQTATAQATQAEATVVAVAATDEASAAQAAASTATSEAEQAATATRVAAVERITATAIAVPTVTAQAVLDATATSIAGVTATAQAELAAVTATAQADSDATSTAVAAVTAQAQQTEAAIAREQANATATVMAIQQATATAESYDIEYQEVDIRDLVKGPDRYQDQKLRIAGQVFNIREEQEGLFGSSTITYIQIWVQIPGGGLFDREAVTIRFENTLPDVFADDYIIVYGEGDGTIEFKNNLGATIRQPLVDAVRIRF
jgi:hypothetical protein